MQSRDLKRIQKSQIIKSEQKDTESSILLQSSFHHEKGRYSLGKDKMDRNSECSLCPGFDIAGESNKSLLEQIKRKRRIVHYW